MSDYITDGQVISIKSAYRSVVKDVPDDALMFITKQFLTYRKELDNIKGLSRDDWRHLRSLLYPNWRNEDWSVGDEAKRKIANAYEQYRETVTGQMRLF